ncbi:unnamed protein product [Linum trigynum]|uniref:Uncharacterized protein n=1 Tax=Linum trigynum TaxID=586398 RepID=A0AAV2D054_9ROSI
MSPLLFTTLATLAILLQLLALCVAVLKPFELFDSCKEWRTTNMYWLAMLIELAGTSGAGLNGSNISLFALDLDTGSNSRNYVQELFNSFPATVAGGGKIDD